MMIYSQPPPTENPELFFYFQISHFFWKLECSTPKILQIEVKRKLFPAGPGKNTPSIAHPPSMNFIIIHISAIWEGFLISRDNHLRHGGPNSLVPPERTQHFDLFERCLQQNIITFSKNVKFVRNDFPNISNRQPPPTDMIDNFFLQHFDGVRYFLRHFECCAIKTCPVHP